MKKVYLLTFYRIFFAGLALAALITQLIHGMRQEGFSTVNFLSFFTIESNIIAVFVLTASALRGRNKQRAGLDFWRGAATLYLTITGIVYTLLLSGADVELTLPWVNSVLHYLMPVAILADWLLDRPYKSIPLRQALAWMVFPAVYLIYSLARGPLANWYPYPFLDPTQHDYPRVVLTSLILAVAAIGLTWLLTGVSNWSHPVEEKHSHTA